MSLGPFKSLLREKCGLSFEDTREALLAEGIKTRLSERRLTSHDEYYAILCREQNEFNSLINLVTINETYFFREPVHFSVLTESLIPDIVGRGDGRKKVKILSAGCSTGEEPYTIVMALMEKFGPAVDGGFSVVGFDIDEAALNSARAGVYARHSFRGVPEHITSKYFDQDGQRYRIRDTVRKGAEFLHLNILGDSWPEAVRNADVVFYRNVSIYFSSEAQQSILRNLAGLLGKKGYLFLSSTETLYHNIGVMSLVEKDGTYLYSKGFEMAVEERRRHRGEGGNTVVSEDPRDRGRRAVGDLVPTGRAGLSRDRSPSKEEEPDGSLPRAVGEARKAFDEALLCGEKKKYEEALALLEESIRIDPSFLKASLLQAGILINMERLDEAETACRRALDNDRWSLEGCLLLGLIEKIRGNLVEAKKRFKEALYIQSSCWVAHFYLGETYRLEGDVECARREFEIVLTQIADEKGAGHGLAFFSLSFSAGQIIHLCRHNLALLS